MNKVLVAPWGNPFGWKEATYVYKDDDENKNVEEKSYSTLPVLRKAIEPDKVILIVLDTLANVEGDKQGFSSYDEIKNDVEERIKRFIDEKLEEDFNGIDLIIAPGVGVFKNIEVEGNMLDYYHYITYKLAELLPDEDMIVYLDLTHGMNFMPVLTYRALSNLLGLASYIKCVKFKVLNFEPYPLGLPQEEATKIKLNIWVVEDREVKPKPILSLLENKNEKFNRWNAFISSIANGFPLIFATFYPKIDEIKKEIESKLRSFYDGISVNGLSIVRSSKLDSDFKTLSKLYYLLRVLNTNKTFRNLPKQEVTLDELKKISETLFNKLPRIGIVVEEQIKSLEDEEKKKDNHDWKQLSKWQPSSRNRAIRNFIAHSGFEFSTTMSKKDETSTKFRYVFEKEEDVISYAIESLRFRLKEG